MKEVAAVEGEGEVVAAAPAPAGDGVAGGLVVAVDAVLGCGAGGGAGVDVEAEGVEGVADLGGAGAAFGCSDNEQEVTLVFAPRIPLRSYTL